MNLTVDIQSASTEPAPEEGDIRHWISSALTGAPEQRDAFEVSVRLVDEAEMAKLNSNYRGKSGATNVLSFPSDLPADLQLPLLGDIVICVPVVAREAGEQGKPLQAHWAHMAVHGTLHLLGYDHINDTDAARMENLETDILKLLDYPCPYTGYPIKGH
jgi:probable rRNA maturation factor